MYNTYISKWNTFCLLENVDKLNSPVFKVCKFLKMLSQQKLSFGAVNTARCALSVLMPDFSKGNSIGKNDWVCRAVHTAYLQNPPKPKYKTFWDVNLVFKVIRTWGANSKMSLQLLSEKLTVLFLLVSGQRGQAIVAIDVDAVVNTDNGLEITLNKPMKTARTGESLQKIRLMSFDIDPRLCIVRVFKEYIKRTEKLRQSPQLLVSCKKPFASVTRDTVSRWVLSVLKKAGVDTAKYGSHSTRGASTSAGALIEDDIDVYVKNLCRKLKKITDKRALLIVQNELDQAVFRATIGLWDSHSVQSQGPTHGHVPLQGQDSRMQSQPPNSQIPH